MALVDRLKRELAQALRARRGAEALDVLTRLERAEPEEACWPMRRARLLQANGEREAAIEGLRHALELQVDQGLVLDAIASCQAILEESPDDAETMRTLDLLYFEGPATGGAETTAVPAQAGSAPRAAAPPEPDEPLDDIVLTEVVPDARPVLDGAAEAGGVNEIPIDGGSTAGEPALDLRLEHWDSGRDLRDVAAAQRLCLPLKTRSGEAAGTPPGSSLRAELANVPLFGELDPASLHRLIRNVRSVSLEPGQVLFREGDPANSLYVIVEGAVVPIAEGDRRRKLAVLEHGAFFGEIGLVTGQPRNATIEALVETKLLAIDRRLIRELIRDEPSVAKGLLRFLRARLIDRQIRTNLFFSAFAHAERAAIARQFRFLEVADGTTLVSRGRVPEGLYVVLSGQLALVSGESGEEKELATLASGDVFGGLSLIEGQLPPGDIVARGKCWLVVLGEGRFRRILEANPCLDRVLRRIARADQGRSSASVRIAD